MLGVPPPGIVIYSLNLSAGNHGIFSNRGEVLLDLVEAATTLSSETASPRLGFFFISVNWLNYHEDEDPENQRVCLLILCAKV